MSSPHRPANAALPSLEGPIPVLFCTAGVVLAAVGVVPWIATAVGAHSGADSWPIRILAVLAFAIGVFVALVGVGLFRARNAVRAARAEAELDTVLVSATAEAVAHDPCATDTACASCDATCALSALR